MIVSISEQTNIFLVAVLTGIVIGIFYDVLRIIRKIIPHPYFLVQLEDLLYWIIISGFMFLVLFTKNYGEIRGFVLLGALLGNMIYFFTISIMIMKFSDWIISWIKKFIHALIKIIFIPINLIAKIMYYPFKWVSYPVKKLNIKTKRIIYKSKNKVKRKTRKIFKEINIMCKKV